MIARAAAAARSALAARGTRKFLRNRIAVAALGVIVLYFLVGFWVVLGEVFPGRIGLSLQQVESPVAPVALPGWTVAPTVERRAEACRALIEEVTRAARAGEDGLRSVRYGRLVLADRPLEDTRAIVRDARAMYRDLEKIDDLDAHPGAPSLVAALEAKVATLWAPLSGWHRFVHCL